MRDEYKSDHISSLEPKFGSVKYLRENHFSPKSISLLIQIERVTKCKMIFTYIVATLGLFCGLSLAHPSSRLPNELPRRQDAPDDAPMCGRIIDAVNDG